MLQSQLFSKTIKKLDKDVVAPSHKLLLRGDFISQLGSGLYTLLPLGFRVYKKIESIIRDEMNRLGAQEIIMPALQPTTLWKESGRLTSIDPPLFTTKDRLEKILVFASTHEEVITHLAKQRILSYKDLPQAVYQIQTKFRNEIRSTGGLLRVREFIMKDLYSFHASKEDLDHFYLKVKKAYLNIFKLVSLKIVPIEAHSGTIGGAESSEFACLVETGEDTVLMCDSCHWAGNKEVFNEGKKEICPQCSKVLSSHRAIENGHIFKLGTKYSSILKAYFVNNKGGKQLLEMGCYGIGLGRLLATVVETHHDEKGIVWPRSIAPFLTHIVPLGHDGIAPRYASWLYKTLSQCGTEVLLDDRNESAGSKLYDSDLIGIPFRIIVSPKTTKKRIEIKPRSVKKPFFMSETKLINLFKHAGKN